MVMVELKRVHKVTSKGRDYYYAWRGGPRISAEPGTHEFIVAYNEAVASVRLPATNKFASVIVRYRASPDYQGLAPSTRKNWGPWLDRIHDHFGKLSTAQFDRADKIKPVIRKWRGEFAATPRKADYAIQVLSRVLSYAIDPLGEIGTNPCEGIKQLYSNSRADIIWTDGDLAAIKPHCSEEVYWAVELAAHSGLRAGDLTRLSWSHVRPDAIIMRTSKSRGRKEAIIPMYRELRELLDRIPKRATTILTSSLKRPWHKDGLSSRFAEAKKEAFPQGTELHFNDLRGTAATKFYLAGFSIREIAEMMGWEEESVDKIIRRYVSLTAALQDKIRRLNEVTK
jgi:integrase